MSGRTKHALRSRAGYSNHVAEFSKFKCVTSKINDVKKLKTATNTTKPIIEKLSNIFNILSGRKGGQAMKSLKVKQLIAVLVFLIGVTSMIILTVTTANKHMALGWYLFGMALSTLVLQLDAWYLEHQIINGQWKKG